jgi:membrane protein implicated in regulation of membrane protease activity
MIVAYVKQETLVPLRQLGRYVGFGIVGSLLLGLGVVLLGVGGLRALQTETGTTFTGDWSWAPYFIMFVVLLLGGAITWKVRNARRDRSERRTALAG